MTQSLNIAVAGATGYVGIELVKILLKHSKARILYLCANKTAGKSMKTYIKNTNIKQLPKITKIKNVIWNKINVLFTALPNGEAQKISRDLPDHVRLIDLSGDFRLENYKEYEKWYGVKHQSINNIKNSTYAVTEFSRNNLRKSKIISCPGCYPTSIQIPLIPLLKKRMINIKNIIIDSKSGYSGAGKGIKNKFKHKYLFNSVSAYGVGNHKHMAEIDQELSKVSNKKIKVFFTPHLIPMFRGILSTIYLETNGNYTAKKIYKFLKKYHEKNYFVKVLKFNKPIGTGDVINTNYCNISVCKSRERNKIIIISAIDNLIKGASGQAVQNMNVAYNIKESMGLI